MIEILAALISHFRASDAAARAAASALPASVLASLVAVAASACSTAVALGLSDAESAMALVVVERRREPPALRLLRPVRRFANA